MSGGSVLQLDMFREHGRVGDEEVYEFVLLADQLISDGWAFETVAGALDLPTQLGVTREERLRQALDIAHAWPEETVMLALRCGAPWGLLHEPAVWWRNGEVEREEMVAFLVGYLYERGRLPSIDAMRVRFGKKSGHRKRLLVDDGQEELL